MKKFHLESAFKSGVLIFFKVLIGGGGIFLLTSLGVATLGFLQGTNQLDFYEILLSILTGIWEEFVLLIIFVSLFVGIINFISSLAADKFEFLKKK